MLALKWLSILTIPVKWNCFNFKSIRLFSSQCESSSIFCVKQIQCNNWILFLSIFLMVELPMARSAIHAALLMNPRLKDNFQNYWRYDFNYDFFSQPSFFSIVLVILILEMKLFVSSSIFWKITLTFFKLNKLIRNSNEAGWYLNAYHSKLINWEWIFFLTIDISCWYVWCVARFDAICTILKIWKTLMEECYF